MHLAAGLPTMYVYHLISQWKMGSVIVSLLCRFVFVMIELETTQSFGWLDGQFSTLNLKESLMQDYFTRGENILAGSIEGLGSKNDPFLKKNSMKGQENDARI